MDRLTRRSKYGYADCAMECQDISKDCVAQACHTAIVRRLAAYEDTELTPEVIDALGKSQIATAADNVRLRTELARVTAERDAAVAEMKRIVDAVQEECETI